MKLFLALVVLLGTVTVAQAQVKNPSRIEFTSPDHEVTTVTGYDVDIVATGKVVQTVLVPKSNVTIVSGTPPTALYSLTINVQPIAFGTYAFVLRTVASALRSDDSPASDPWTRVPGAPSKPVAK